MGVRRALRRWLPHAAALVGLAGVAALTGGWVRYSAALLVPVVAIHAVRRRIRDVLVTALAAAVSVAVLVLVMLRIDLGPVVRARAEAAGSKFVHRPMHIGKLGVHLWTGRFVVEDLVIEGVTPSDTPFLKAKTISLSVPWWTILRSGDIRIESVEMSDWEMQVELFEKGGHSLPKFGSDQPAGGSGRVTTMVRSVHAERGRFTYLDHGTWRTVAPNLDVRVSNVGGEYVGTASVTNGTVSIKEYEPMRTDMRCAFKIRDGRIILHSIELYAGASQTIGTGEVNFRHWPEQIYRVRSRVDFQSMKEVFFARREFSTRGQGDFVGAFHYFKGGYELKGDFASDLATVNRYAFPALRGSLVWEPRRFAVTQAAAQFHGGAVRFSYSYGPMGRPTPAVARFEAEYEDVDLGSFTDFLETKGLRLAGRVSGHNVLEWPSGRWPEHRGEGHLVARPPDGVALLTRTSGLAPAGGGPLPPGPAEPDLRVQPRRMGIGGEVTYRYGPEWVDIDPSHLATETTHVAFEGRTAYGDRSRVNFRARTTDLQDADRLLAGTITAFGRPTRTISVGGFGQFDAVLVKSFRNPRVEGRFTGDQVRAWDVVWGRLGGSFAVENDYMDVTGAAVTRDDGQMLVDGRFSLGYPRKDGQDEIDARVRMTRWDLKDLRHAFRLDDYPIDGKTSGEYHLYGRYARPFGFGRMTLADGAAYGERIDSATLPLRFEGTGVRLDAIEIIKSTGRVTGAAYIGWDGRYSFNADGRGIPVESLALFKYPQAPMSGLLQFAVAGASTFAHPAYDLRGRIDDLFLKDEGIGQVTARLAVQDDIMSVELEAASPRLAISGAGQIARARTADAELTLRFTDTSLDPYVRVFQPGLLPFSQAVASGSLHIVGQLSNPDRLLVEATVDRLDLRLFDYKLTNSGPIRLALDRKTVRLDQVRLEGEDTRLALTGTASIPDDRVAVVASGEANLAVLQLAFPNLRSTGRAALTAEIYGPLSKPMLAGFATLANGRIRHFSLPHSIDALNGRISFSNGAIRLDDVTAQIGGGPVTFGGLIGLTGYAPNRLALTASARDLQLRYPEGFRSVVDADLALVGSMASPTLAGTVTVKSAVYRRRIDLDFTRLGVAAAMGSSADAGAGPAETTLPLRFDLQVRAPSALRVESNSVNIVSGAYLTLRGTFDRPLLFGRAEIERGWAVFEGKRFIVTHGTVDFNNPARIEPVFDFAAETRIRAPGQTYNVDVRVSGPTARLAYQLNSDPPLPQLEILSLLFGDRPNVQDAELRSLRNPNALRTELITSRLTQAAASSLASPVNRAVEETFGLDTFQIRPSLAQDAYQRFSASARLTFGKRISNRLYLTYSRSLSATSRDQIILIEYDQNDRLSWILSQNEDNTYALDVRVRYVR